MIPTVHRGGSDVGDAETSNWVGISRVERSDPDQKMKGEMVFYDPWEPKIACFGVNRGRSPPDLPSGQLKLSFWRVEGRVRTPSATAQIDLS